MTEEQKKSFQVEEEEKNGHSHKYFWRIYNFLSKKQKTKNKKKVSFKITKNFFQMTNNLTGEKTISKFLSEKISLARIITSKIFIKFQKRKMKPSIIDTFLVQGTKYLNQYNIIYPINN